MFIDASAILAILFAEQDSQTLLERAMNSPVNLVYSPLARFEAVVGFARRRAGTHRSSTAEQIEEATEIIDGLFVELGAKCMDLSETIGTRALTAAQTYGRAVGHPAGLNLGDCFAYACAKERGVGLLYKGGDFAATDLG